MKGLQQEKTRGEGNHWGKKFCSAADTEIKTQSFVQSESATHNTLSLAGWLPSFIKYLHHSVLWWSQYGFRKASES